jgi:PEP-CTERM motif
MELLRKCSVSFFGPSLFCHKFREGGTKMKKLVSALCFGGVCFLGSIGIAQASITGSVWENVSTTVSQDATIAQASSLGTADAQFTPAQINFNSNGSTDYTVGSFLNNPAFYNTSGSFSASNTLNNSYMLFTGSTYLNAGANSFVTPHDDGFELAVSGAYSDSSFINAFDFSQPGPTSPVYTPYTVYAPTAGMYDFTLSYGECCGPPAVLGFSVNGAPVTSAVPEPRTYAMLLAGLGLIGFIGRRQSRNSRMMAFA